MTISISSGYMNIIDHNWLTWIKAIKGDDFPTKSMISVRPYHPAKTFTKHPVPWPQDHRGWLLSSPNLGGSSCWLKNHHFFFESNTDVGCFMSDVSYDIWRVLWKPSLVQRGSHRQMVYFGHGVRSQKKVQKPCRFFVVQLPPIFREIPIIWGTTRLDMYGQGEYPGMKSFIGPPMLRHRGEDKKSSSTYPLLI